MACRVTKGSSSQLDPHVRMTVVQGLEEKEEKRYLFHNGLRRGQIMQANEVAHANTWRLERVFRFSLLHVL